MPGLIVDLSAAIRVGPRFKACTTQTGASGVSKNSFWGFLPFDFWALFFCFLGLAPGSCFLVLGS